MLFCFICSYLLYVHKCTKISLNSFLKPKNKKRENKKGFLIIFLENN